MWMAQPSNLRGILRKHDIIPTFETNNKSSEDIRPALDRQDTFLMKNSMGMWLGEIGRSVRTGLTDRDRYRPLRQFNSTGKSAVLTEEMTYWSRKIHEVSDLTISTEKADLGYHGAEPLALANKKIA